MIDTHCHILPGVDDGPRKMEQSIAMAKMAVDDGIDTIIATPHYIKGEFDLSLSQINDILIELNLCLKKEDIQLTILPGAEVHIDPLIIQMLDKNRLTLNNTNYLLLELPISIVPGITLDMIYHLLLAGIIPIIAHPERNMEIIRDPNKLYELIQGGALTQITCSSIMGTFGKEVQKTALTLLTHNMVHFIGTDSHSDKLRQPNMKKSVDKINLYIGKDMMERIVYDNPQKMIKGELINIDEPEMHKPRKFFWGRNK